MIGPPPISPPFPSPPLSHPPRPLRRRAPAEAARRSCRQSTAACPRRTRPARPPIAVFGSRGFPRASLCGARRAPLPRSEEHTSELQSRLHLVCRLLPDKKTNFCLVLLMTRLLFVLLLRTYFDLFASV